MRAGVWWSAVALAFLAITSALRTPQVEGATRASRRVAVPTAPDNNGVASTGPDTAQSTLNSRGIRRREEIPSSKDTIRSRTRSRTEVPSSVQNQPQPSQTNERFDSRRTRTRSQPIDVESNKDVSLPREPVIRSRNRGSTRGGNNSIRRPSSTTPTPAAIEITSPTTIDNSKDEIVNSSRDDITKISKEPPTIPPQTRRRNSVAATASSKTIAPMRSRGRINTRTSENALDLTVSGTTNTLSIADKVPTTARTAADLRNSRKLRYRSQLTETDSNLTGEGHVLSNDVIKSSQMKESNTSQHETITTAPVIAATIIQHSTEPNKQKTTTIKVTRVVRRPLSRGKVNLRPSVSIPNVSKVSDEISEDDNYPPSFKALIQAKNASTQTSSPTSENLSLKASQKVYKTYSASSQSTLTGPATNKYSRYRNKQAVEESKK